MLFALVNSLFAMLHKIFVVSPCITLNCVVFSMLRFCFTLCMYHFIFSTTVDENLKAWLYYLMGSRVAYNVHSQWCTTMAYTADGTRFIHSVVLVVALHHALPLLSNCQTIFS